MRSQEGTEINKKRRTVERVGEAIATLITACVILFFVTVMWVGLEYIVEGAVHTSTVDAIVAAVWSWNIAATLAAEARRRGKHDRD